MYYYTVRVGKCTPFMSLCIGYFDHLRNLCNPDSFWSSVGFLPLGCLLPEGCFQRRFPPLGRPIELQICILVNVGPLAKGKGGEAPLSLASRGEAPLSVASPHHAPPSRFTSHFLQLICHRVLLFISVKISRFPMALVVNLHLPDLIR